MNKTRIYAILIRHYFMTLHHMERFFDVFIFPVMALILWGFISKYVQNVQSLTLANLLLGGLILWVIYERVQTDVGISFMYDVWERNVVSFLSTPLKTSEYIVGMVIISLIKVALSFLVMWIISALFYNFWITDIGLMLALFWMNLILMATSFGIFNISLVLRFGVGVGPLTWILPFFLQPFSAVFYPVSVLPIFLQKIAYFIPLSHVFEGLRYSLNSGKFDANSFWTALILNLIFFTFCVSLFAWTFRSVKKSGRLVKLN